MLSSSNHAAAALKPICMSFTAPGGKPAMPDCYW